LSITPIKLLLISQIQIISTFMKIKLFNLLVINALCFSVALKAQVQSKLDLALRAIEQNAKVWGLNPDDIIMV